MSVPTKGTNLVGRRFRRASWIFGFSSLATFAYVGTYVVALLAGVGFWGIFQLLACAVSEPGN